jgi:hypothetical protein
LLAGEHVPDRLGQSAGEVDLGDFRAALCADPRLGLLVAVAVDGWVRACVAASTSAQGK